MVSGPGEGGSGRGKNRLKKYYHNPSPDQRRFCPRRGKKPDRKKGRTNLGKKRMLGNTTGGTFLTATTVTGKRAGKATPCYWAKNPTAGKGNSDLRKETPFPVHGAEGKIGGGKKGSRL